MDMQVAALDILTTKGGFAPEAARAIGEAMDLQIARSYEDLATNQRLDEARVLLRSDITALDAKVDRFRMELKADIAAFEVKFQSKIDSLRMELKCDIAALEVKMEKLKSDIVRWVFAAVVGQTAVMVALMRLSMPHGP
jgi:hypothetical protein